MSATINAINTNVKNLEEVRLCLQQLLLAIQSGAYAPSGAAGGDLTGTYPNPTVGTNKVGNTKLAQMAANSIKGNNTGGPANALDLTVAQTKALLAITESDVASLVTDLAARALASRLINTTAPITGGGDLNADRTIAISDCTATVRGAVPTPPNDTTKFLRGDATWDTIPSSGGITAYSQKSANYVILSGDKGTFFDVDSSGAARTLTLPTGVTAGFTIWIRKSDSSGNFVFIQPNGADGINGGTLGATNGSTIQQQYYGYCLTYTGVAGNGAGQGWIMNYMILPTAVSTGLLLRSNGTGQIWQQVVLTTDVTGVLPDANGGAMIVRRRGWFI